METAATTSLQAIAPGHDRIVGVGGNGATVRTAIIEPYVATPAEPFGAIAGEIAGISVTPIGGPPFNLAWYREEEWVADTEDPVLEIADVSPEDAGDYRILVTSASGSTWSEAEGWATEFFRLAVER